MRILLLLSESWNDVVHPNNNLTNWFNGCSNIEIWTISGNATMPYNSICKHYFIVDEIGMAKSILTKKAVGRVLNYDETSVIVEGESSVGISPSVKKMFSSEFARLCRDIVWRFGRYNETLLENFINRCNPDVVFSQRMGSVKMCRLESIVHKYTNAPFAVYTGDDDFSLKQYNFNPLYWIRRLWTRKWISKMAPHYKLLYSQSERQMNEYSNNWGIQTKFLVKSGDFNLEKVHSSVSNPIQVVYGGKLYCNRWRTLVLLADAIGKVNAQYNETRIQLHIYTSDPLTSTQLKKLNVGHNSMIHQAVSGSELKRIYVKSDLLIHVEGFDKKNRLLTKDSFSTKVMDCLSSGCAVMAIAWEEHAALKYLREKNAALTATNYNELEMIVSSIVSDPMKLIRYANNAYACGLEFHNRNDIQNSIIRDFKLISEKC